MQEYPGQVLNVDELPLIHLLDHARNVLLVRKNEDKANGTELRNGQLGQTIQRVLHSGHAVSILEEGCSKTTWTPDLHCLMAQLIFPSHQGSAETPFNTIQAGGTNTLGR